MKFKTWVTATLLMLTAMYLFILFFTDNILLHIACLAAALLKVILLTKFSKICE